MVAGRSANLITSRALDQRWPLALSIAVHTVNRSLYYYFFLF